MVALAENKMARQDLTVKMGMDVIRKAKVVALHRNITLAEYLTERIRPMVDQDYVLAVSEMAKETRQDKKGGSK